MRTAICNSTGCGFTLEKAKIDNNKWVGNDYQNYTNRNGEYLLDLSIDCGLVNISTKF